MADIDLDAIEARANAAAPVAWIDSRGTFQSHYAADVPRLVAEVRDQREVIAGLDEAVTALRHARDRQRDLRLGLLAANEALVEAVDAERDELRATVERVRALVDDYEAEAAIESNRPSPNSKRAVWELNERIRDIREALDPS